MSNSSQCVLPIYLVLLKLEVSNSVAHHIYTDDRALVALSVLSPSSDVRYSYAI